MPVKPSGILEPAANPYAPGAGTRPPLLAGRDGELDEAARLIGRARLGYVDQPRLAVGVRGVGKTVLLLAIRDEARRRDAVTVHVQARAGEGFVRALLRELDIELRRRRGPRGRIEQALGVVAALAITVGGVRVAARPAVGRADSGDLALDLIDLFAAVCQAADAPLVITVDELGELRDGQLSALLVAVQRAGSEQLPLVMVAAGLPGVLRRAAEVESFAERLFGVWDLGPLPSEAATAAVVDPARDAGGVEWEPEAVAWLVTAAGGYPFYLQHFAATTWDTATSTPITLRDTRLGVERAEARLADSLVRSRLERLSAKERAYVVALAGLGPGPHRSGEVAAAMGVGSSAVATTRSRLIAAGVVHAPRYGQVAFTVPMFDRHVREQGADRGPVAQR